MRTQVILLALVIGCWAVGDAYDEAVSKEFAVLSGLAFCPASCIERWDCQGGKDILLTDVSYIQNTITLAVGYVGYYAKRDMIVAVFRGSDNIENWIEDFNFQQVPYVYCFNCRIHAGFYADYLLLEPAVNAKVQKLVDAHPTATILASGHSLGAALASISAMQLKMKFNNRVVIHNFGSPRIGNPNLAKHIMNRVDTVYRVVHNRDIVPHLPPDLLPFDYHHPAFEVFFDEAMENYKVCSSTGEDGSCSNKFFPDYSTDDHDFYFVNISKTKC